MLPCTLYLLGLDASKHLGNLDRVLWGGHGVKRCGMVSYLDWCHGCKRRWRICRKIDLDLIAFGDEQRNAETLTLPHPCAHERQFVLAPMVEIAPDLIFPGRTKTVQMLLDELPDQGAVKLGESLL